MLTRSGFVSWALLAAVSTACGSDNHNGTGNESIGGRTGETGGATTAHSTRLSGGAAGLGGTATSTGGTSSTASRTGGTSEIGGAKSTAAGGSSSTATVRAGGTSAIGGTSHSGGISSSDHSSMSFATGGTSNSGGTKASAGGTAATGGTKNNGGTSSLGSSSATLTNVADVVVDDGLTGLPYMNGLFVDVTLCVPGTSTCQTIDHVLVDTGSYGLRVLESALTLSLPAVTNTSGAVLAECTQYVSGTAWGPIVRADVKIGGETASSIPIQTVGENKYPMPSAAACTGVALNDRTSLRSNGILGVGIYQQDCGDSCTKTTGNPGIYMACTSTQAGGCKAVAIPLDLQVSNPIVSFTTNNNGLIIQLPDVPDQGAASVSGKIVFGIGTQSNNGLGSAKVYTAVNNYGYIGTTFPEGGTQYQAVLDSGSNAIYFLNASTTGITACPAPSDGFYCPASTTNLSATLFGGGGSSSTVSFKVANISKVSGSIAAFKNVGGEMPGFPSANAAEVDFIWGLAFFYGRTVFTAIEQKSSPGGTGPYVAF